MSRNADSIRQAFSKVQGTKSRSETLNFPPGHFVGFFLSIDGGQIVVSEGEANVAGHSVRLARPATLEENAWAVTRSAQHMYFIYLKRDGNFWVDTNDPTWMSMYNGFYHPVLAYRYLGKVFVDSTGKLIYKLSAHYDQQSQIVVGAKGYTGYMDYECDGEEDQEQINLALKFANEWGEYGGKVHLTRGGFFTTAAIEMKSNTSLEGEGAGATVIEKDCNDHAIEAVGTSAIMLGNVSVSGMTVKKASADTNDNVPLFYSLYVTDLLLADVRFDDGRQYAVDMEQTSGTMRGCSIYNCYSGITISSSIGITVSECLITGPMVSGASAGNGIVITDGAVNILDNTIRDITTYVGFFAISLSGSDGCVVRGNHITNVVCQRTEDDAGQCVMISVGGSAVNGQISGNRIENCTTGTYVFRGIGIVAGCTGTVVTDNMAVDNGNLIDRGNCESSDPPAMYGEVAVTESNATFARSNTYADVGTYSYKFTKTVAAGDYGAVGLADSGSLGTTDMHGMIAGLTYTLSSRVHIPSGGMVGGEVMAGIRYYNAGVWTYTSSSAAVTYDAWQTVTATVTIPATATGAYPRLYSETTAENGEVFYVDNIRLRPDGVGNDYTQNFSDAGTGTLTNGNTWEI